MERSEFRAMQNKLQMTNFGRHLRQADRAAGNAGVIVAGVILIYQSAYADADEVHYFGVPWIEDPQAKEIRKAAHAQLGEIIEAEK